MAQVQFAAQAYTARSAPLDAQRAVNVFVEISPKDAKTPVPVYACPGLKVYAKAGSGPINGLHAMGGTLYVLSGSDLFSVDSDGLATLIGATNLGGVVMIADNTQQMVMVDGFVGWIYQPGGLTQVTTVAAASGATSITVASTGFPAAGDTIKIAMDDGTTFTTTLSGAPTGPPSARVLHLAAALPSTLSVGAVAIDPAVVLGQITAPAFRAAATVTYFDTYFIFEAAGTRQFFLSAIGNGTQYDALDFATAQAGATNILAVLNYHEQLLLMCADRVEVWYDAGAANFPFQRFDGAFIQRGIAGPRAWCKEDNTVLWLGEDGIFYRLEGYTPLRISTFAMEHAWAQYSTTADAVAFCVTIEGHKFMFLNFPSGGATWCYDISGGAQQPLWHERQSQGSAWVG